MAVLDTISFGNGGAGGSLFQSWLVSQSLTNCLSKLGCVLPGWYFVASQNLLESGVSISSIKVNWSSMNPNSNLVSAIIIPFVKAKLWAKL